jgi:hypothetical protein
MSITKAIRKINPNATFKYIDEDIDTIEWLSETPPISKADIEAKMLEVQVEHNATQYQRDRKEEYPTIGDQLDALWKGGEEADAMKIIVNQVKEKYPKE